jgi:hypothetical protein
MMNIGLRTCSTAAIVARANAYIGTLRTLRSQYGDTALARTGLGVPSEFLTVRTDYAILEGVAGTR